MRNPLELADGILTWINGISLVLYGAYLGKRFGYRLRWARLRQLCRRVLYGRGRDFARRVIPVTERDGGRLGICDLCGFPYHGTPFGECRPARAGRYPGISYILFP